MKVYILMGSPRKNGNTASLLDPFVSELARDNVEIETVWLYDKEINSCISCRVCQKDWTKFGCFHSDDVGEIFDGILDADLIILATPIYSWYCTSPMKALLDRLVYGMNKYYGEEKGPALWEGKKLSIITTCGYRPEKAADLFEEGMKRYCKHSKLEYLGMLAERSLGYNHDFMNTDKKKNAEEFAKKIYKLCQNE